MFGRVEWEAANIIRIDRITDEAPSGVGVESDHEEEGQVVSIPECLEALLADLMVRRGIHYEHYEKHEVSSDATGLGIMDLERCLLANF